MFEPGVKSCLRVEIHFRPWVETGEFNKPLVRFTLLNVHHDVLDGRNLLSERYFMSKFQGSPVPREGGDEKWRGGRLGVHYSLVTGTSPGSSSVPRHLLSLLIMFPQRPTSPQGPSRLSKSEVSTVVGDVYLSRSLSWVLSCDVSNRVQ